MGFFFRRQKSFGPFRFTASKSGLGVSMKLGPVRVSRGATGRKSVSARTGVRGVSYRKRF